MTIEIHRPELEALIMQRMKMGGFNNVEDALQASHDDEGSGAHWAASA